MTDMVRAFYEYLVTLEAYYMKMQVEWTDAERCRKRIERASARLERLYAPQLKARERDFQYDGYPLIASSASWSLEHRARADAERARASCVAIVLLLDGLQQRLFHTLRRRPKAQDFTFGPRIGSANLAQLLFVTANSVRHADEWARLPWTRNGYNAVGNPRAETSLKILNAAFGMPVHIKRHVCWDALLLLGLPSTGKDAAVLLSGYMRDIARDAAVQWLGSEGPFADAEDEIGAENVYEMSDFDFVY